MPSEKNDLSISIVIYKTDPVVLHQALTSIANSTMTSKLYVIDNSPNKELRQIVEGFASTYIHTGKNIGFGPGHNLALKNIGNSSKYHLLLNPDISFGTAVLDELRRFLDANPHIGWVMPNVLYPDGSRQKLCKRLPTPWDLFNRRFLMAFGLKMPFGNRGRFECNDLDLSRPRRIPCLSGCFAFVRTDLLQAAGGFDERFFMYLEDTDLVRRIGEIAPTVFYPHVSVYHAHARGSYRSLKLLAHHLLSTVRYFRKWGWFFDRKRMEINRSIDRDERTIVLPDRSPAWRSGEDQKLHAS